MTTWPWQLSEGSFDDWYVLYDAKHRRVADSDVEGTAEEWRAIAAALRKRESVSFKRCRLWWDGPVEFCLDSPRNTMGRPARHAKADELADIIEAALPRVAAATEECRHEDFTAKVDVQRIAGDDGAIRNYVADIAVSCSACGLPFHFVGPDCGLSFVRPTVSVGATTLHAPIAPGEGPLPDRIRFEVVGDTPS